MEYLRENMGGIASIQTLAISYVQYWPALSDDGTEYLSEIVLVSGKSWSEAIPFSKMADFTETDEDTDNGILYRSTLNATIAKYDASNIGVNSPFKTPRIIKFTDANGECFIMGDPSRPVTILNNRATGRVPADRNQIDIQITHAAPFPCPLYDF